MKIVVLLAGIASSLFVSTAASAQEDSSPSPSLSGAWVGVVLGAEQADLGGKKHEKPTYGVNAGYDFSTNGLRAGVEVEASKSNSSGCSHDVTRNGDSLCTKSGRDLYAGARVGAMVLPNLFLYAKGGYVNGSFSSTYEDGTSGTANDYKSKRNASGWRAGAGVERDFNNAFLRVEYRYSRYAHGFSKHQGVASVGLRF